MYLKAQATKGIHFAAPGRKWGVQDNGQRGVEGGGCAQHPPARYKWAE